MDPKLTTHELPPARKWGDMPRWEVRYDGALIGWVQSKRVGSGRRGSLFYEGIVLIEDRQISLDLDTSFESRCAKVLDARLDPRSTPQTRYWLGLDQ